MQLSNGHASLTNGIPHYPVPSDRHERTSLVGQRSVNRSSEHLWIRDLPRLSTAAFHQQDHRQIVRRQGKV